MAGNNLLAPYIRQVYKRTLIDAPTNHEEQVFGCPETAPRLDSSRVNRILVYPGSFNPPHRGHLHLLSHVFHHGVPDLNVVAAIGRVLQLCILLGPIDRDNCLISFHRS